MGNGWSAVVLDDQTELDFLRQGQKGWTNPYSYWVNGSTNAEPYEFFDFDSLIKGDSGNYSNLIRILISKFMQKITFANTNKCNTIFLSCQVIILWLFHYYHLTSPLIIM